MHKIKSEKGIILIEAILALGVIIVVMTALVTALTSSLSSTNFSKEQSLATTYAQQGLEIARNNKDSNFDNFSGLNTGYHCLRQGSENINNAIIVTQPSGCGGNI